MQSLAITVAALDSAAFLRSVYLLTMNFISKGLS